MITGIHYDEAVSKRLVAIYTTPDVVWQRQQLLEFLEPRPGERVLDVGSGAGFLAALLGDAVGPSGWVCGVDISEPLLGMSRSQCAHQPWVVFEQADATRLPFANEQFDAAVSAQVLEYVLEVDTALAELYRVLRPGGRLLILDTDWDSIVWHSSNSARMNRVLAAWEKHCPDPHLPRTLAPRLGRADFRLKARRIIPLFNPEFNANTYSNTLAELIADFVSEQRGVTTEEVGEWLTQLRQKGEQGDYFFSLSRYLFVVTKPGPSADVRAV